MLDALQALGEKPPQGEQIRVNVWSASRLRALSGFCFRPEMPNPLGFVSKSLWDSTASQTSVRRNYELFLDRYGPTAVVLVRHAGMTAQRLIGARSLP